MEGYRYLETGSHDPCYNLAFEEYVLCHRTEGTYLILWQNDNTIVVGQNQNTFAEVNRSVADARGIRVVRRMTGGGAVYHDLGNFNYSFISDANGDFGRAFTAVVVDALRALGVDAAASGRNDITVGEQKLSGTAQRLCGGRILHHGTLLFDSDLDAVAAALRVDPAKFQSKHTKSVRSRVGNIRPLLQKDMTGKAFQEYLKGALTSGGYAADALTTDELAAVRALRRSKYATEQWNWGSRLPSSFCSKRRLPGGSLEICADIVNGTIHALRFYGDFLSLRPQDELLAALEGCPYERSAAAAVISRFSVSELFGGITACEILDTLFDNG